MFEVDLFKYLKENENIPLRDRMEIAIAIGNGIEGMENGFRLHHLDLKPSNIYLKTKDGKRHGRICIADFGITRFEYLGLSDARTGTALFSSPEQLVSRANHKSDIFAYGKMLVLIIFKWKMGWWLLGSRRDEKVAKFFKMNPLTENFCDLVSKMLDVDLEERPEIDEVMESLKDMQEVAGQYEDQWQKLHERTIGEVLLLLLLL